MLNQIKAQVPVTLNGERFDVAASQLCPQLSRKKIKMVIDRGGAYLNKKRIIFAKKSVVTDDLIELFWDDDRPLTAQIAKTLSVQILENNSDFVVINKPAGLPSQATLESTEGTVIHALCAQYPEKFSADNLFLVHRLDKETSGIMLLAKNKKTKVFFDKLFSDRKIKKAYWALVFGIPARSEGLVQWPLRKDSSRPNAYLAVMNPGKMRTASSHSSECKTALTRYVVLKTFLKVRASLVECSPETGRTHQIRVHMQALGVPLLGDKTYSSNIIGHACGQWAVRHMLHARSLSWTTEDGQTFAFESPLSDDFQTCLKRLEQEG